MYTLTDVKESEGNVIVQFKDAAGVEDSATFTYSTTVEAALVTIAVQADAKDAARKAAKTLADGLRAEMAKQVVVAPVKDVLLEK